MLYVTGITGHSGKWFLKRLSQERYPGKIRCVMRCSYEEAPEKYAIFKGCGLDIEFAVGDLNEEAFLRQSLAGAAIIVHTAGITLSEKLVPAAIEAGVNWAILVHTTGRFSRYKSASAGYVKIEDEILALRDAGKIDATVLRPTMIYGSSGDRNMYRLIGYLARHRFFPMFGDGGNLMQPVHARDLGNAYYDVLAGQAVTRNKEYDLSGKAPISYRTILETISRCLKRKTILVHLPMGFSIFAARVYGAVFGRRAIISVEQVMRMNEDKAFSHEAAARDFGYSPCSFEEGIRAEVEEYRSGVRFDFSNLTYQ